MGRRETFGEYLRACRLKAGYGLRVFAEAIEMQPSNLSNVEHGRLPPPQDLGTLTRIAEALGFPEGSKERERLFDLAVAAKGQKLPADLAAFAAKTPGIPVILRTLQNRRLSRKEIEDLTQYINRRLKVR
ncbi:MAG: helix-turn-helix domain-containing protein [candidate division NC10 bacterium]|nr:helix-turn-helix domain-containing protein [candidate division NC10 bacterium]MBI2458296.1 helix-turn-helix domain-containing protein [candidate division NC10 bacterium]MBI3087081.1 helix-turn-helix domain-containing protein [candidate division NC10 bacterium]